MVEFQVLLKEVGKRFLFNSFKIKIYVDDRVRNTEITMTQSLRKFTTCQERQIPLKTI